MNNIQHAYLLYDWETTGFPLYSGASLSDPRQPHGVSVSALLCDEQGNIVAELDEIIRPDGWVSDPGALAVHGITEEQALAEGRPEADVLHQLMVMMALSRQRVAYNESFDQKITRIALARYVDEEAAEQFRSFPEPIDALAMVRATKAYSQNTLANVYLQMTGERHDAHRSRADVWALHRIFFQLKREAETKLFKPIPLQELGIDGLGF